MFILIFKLWKIQILQVSSINKGRFYIIRTSNRLAWSEMISNVDIVNLKNNYSVIIKKQNLKKALTNCQI